MEDSDIIVGDIYKELLGLKDKLISKGEIKSDQEIELHLIDNLFPVLFPALEELSKEVEKYRDPNFKIDPNIRSRFNPCLFLGQYLMRNNPKYHPEFTENSMFLIFSERVRKTRTFESTKKEFEEYFKKNNNGELNLSAKAIDTVIAKIDSILGLNGTLSNHIQLSDVIIGYKERKQSIPIEEFYKEFQHVCVKNYEIKDKDIKEKLLPVIKGH